MKTNTIVTDITHENLVNLFSTSTYGSNWLMIRSHRRDYYGTPLEDDNDCREDKWAKILLNGGSVEAFDYYAEGESYGDLPHKIEEDDDECVHYTVTLKDIEKGIAKCIDLGGWEAECARHLISEPEQMDITEAEAIMQVIVFGEVIYG